MVAQVDGGRAGGADQARSPSCIPSGARNWPRSFSARWANRWTRSLGEVDFSAAIYEYYADNAEKFLADEPIDLLDGEGAR